MKFDRKTLVQLDAAVSTIADLVAEVPDSLVTRREANLLDQILMQTENIAATISVFDNVRVSIDDAIADLRGLYE